MHIASLCGVKTNPLPPLPEAIATQPSLSPCTTSLNPNLITPASPNSPTFSSLNAPSYQSPSCGQLHHKPPPTHPHIRRRRKMQMHQLSAMPTISKRIKTFSLLNTLLSSRSTLSHNLSLLPPHAHSLFTADESPSQLHNLLQLSISSKPTFFTFKIQNAITYCIIIFHLPSKSLSLSLQEGFRV